MSAADTENPILPATAELVALVRAQLAPIPSRPALLDSYRRESLYRLAPSGCRVDAAESVLELAYAARWAELADTPGAGFRDGPPWEFQDG